VRKHREIFRISRARRALFCPENYGNEKACNSSAQKASAIINRIVESAKAIVMAYIRATKVDKPLRTFFR